LKKSAKIKDNFEETKLAPKRIKEEGKSGDLADIGYSNFKF